MRRFAAVVPSAVLLAVLTLVAVLAVPTAGAQTVDELVAKNLEARGGVARLDAIRSLRFTGEIVFGGGDNRFQGEWGELLARPGMIRDEMTLQGLTAVEAWDGHDAWSLSPFRGRREAQRDSADDARERARDAEIGGPLLHWREKGHTVEYLGTEDVDGTPAYKLRVNLKDGDTQILYLDPDYYLEIRVQTASHERGSERITEADLGSYGQVAGVWFPFSIEAGGKGRPRSTRLTITHAEADVEVDPALFAFPAAGTPIVRSILSGEGAAEGAGEVAEAAPPPPPGSAAAGHGPAIDSGVVSGLGARNIGSAAMSGRIAAVAARNEGGKTTIFVGSASGGVWRSRDGGTTFEPVFDRQPVQSIGAVTIDPSHSEVVWVGTGESWTRNTVSVGDGIYKSTDGGDTWANVGLPESERIVKILVHPTKSDVVYACVPGKLWSDGAERGVFRTVDGGATWSRVLAGPNLSTGCSGLTMDPADPDVLLAGLWDFRRTGWTFRSGGDGPDAPSGSGLYRSEDGGATWTEQPAGAGGLPAKPWGRVEVTYAPSDAKVVYALVESVDSALYRSDDGGRTWEARDRSQGMVWRPFYFGRLVVDPTDADHVFKAGGDLIVSDDGGKSFAETGGGGHGDWHDVWVDPDNPRHVVAGDDGGLWLAFDGGSRWWKMNNLPVSQFYHVAVDDRDPYQVYGGLQDNGSWVGDSAYPGGITNSRWENLYGGDGFWAVPDPTDSDAVYAESQGGYIGRVDRRTLASRDIQPQAGPGEKLRFNWNTPVVIPPTQPGTIYMGAQFLFRSRDRGDTWERISPDLTTDDPEKQKQEESGGITVDNSSAETHTTIYAIAPSPLDGAVLWVGTDDGNLQLTRDGGGSWTNLSSKVPGLPPFSWVSWIEAGHSAKAIAYAAFDRHTFGDVTPWVYRTTDFGATWTRIATPGDGVRGYAHVIKEDPVEPSLLYLGTEFGLWISPDGGRSWAEFKGGDFPSVAVRDLQIHPRDRDLVIATHGRGIWVIDDLTPLRALVAGGQSGAGGGPSPAVAAAQAQGAVFLAGRLVQQRMPANGGWVEGDAAFVGRNPPAGAVLSYYQPTRHLFGSIQLEVFDASGALVDTLVAGKRRGINRVVWPMKVKPPRVPRAATLAFYASQGPRVPPGTYTVRLTKGGRVIETKVEVGLDRRAPYTVEDRRAQFAAVMKAHALFEEMSALVDRIDAARAAAAEALAALPEGDPGRTGLASRIDRLDAVKRKIVATKEGGAITGEERIREHLDNVYGALNGWEGRPAPYQVERVETLRGELEAVHREFDAIGP